MQNVSGIKFLTKNYHMLQKKHVVLFTCGLAAPDNPTTVKHIRKSLTHVLSPEILEHLCIFHFRSGIDYAKLNPVHKSMMAMMRKMLLQKDAADLSDEVFSFPYAIG